MHNGDAVSTTALPPAFTPPPPKAEAQPIAPMAPLDDEAIFSLLGSLAEKTGRPDLVEEFRRRANASKPAPVPAAKAPAGPEPKPKDAGARTAVPPIVAEGLRLLQEGKLLEAVEKLREAIRRHPNDGVARGNLGVAHARLKQFAEAEQCFRDTLRLQPESASMYGNLGASCLDQGKLAEAEEAFREGTKRDPNRADFHRQLANVLEKQGRHAEAVDVYRTALNLEPADAEAHARLGRALNKIEKPGEAEACFREAARLRPDSAVYWKQLGASLESQSKSAEAESAYRTALTLAPNDAETHNNLGVSLASQNRLEEAEALYRKAVELAPNMAMVHNNLGHNLRMQDRLDEAAASLKEAIRLQPNYSEAHNNLGIAYLQQGRMAEAAACYEEALRIKPEYAEAHLNRALLWLTQGNLEQGWAEYEWRFKLKNRKMATPVPRWEGNELNGRTLLLQAEQGLGDTVQFIRYASLIPRGVGGTVVLECQEPLVELARTCPGIDKVVPRGEKLPNFDVISPLLSLPGIVRTTVASIPADVPYITPDPTRSEHWHAEIKGLPGRKVGIAWQGSVDHKGDRARSVPLSCFRPLASVPGIRLCSLQKGAGSEQLKDDWVAEREVVDFGSKTQPTYADTVALLRTLDLVITIDTSMAHVAGALGVPVWILLPFANDWRWLNDGEDTPWYPTMRLFRQQNRNDWDAVFQRVIAALKQWPDRLRMMPAIRKSR